MAVALHGNGKKGLVSPEKSASASSPLSSPLPPTLPHSQGSGRRKRPRLSKSLSTDYISESGDVFEGSGPASASVTEDGSGMDVMSMVLEYPLPSSPLTPSTMSGSRENILADTQRKLKFCSLLAEMATWISESASVCGFCE